VPQLEVANFLGELLDPLFTAVFRALLKVVGCQIECSETESGFRVFLVLVLLFTLGILGYIIVSKQKQTNKGRRKRRS